MLEILVFASAVFFCVWYCQRTRHAVPLPPGPPGDLILGHARKFPRKSPHLTFIEWGKQYGDVLYLHILGKPIIVLNSHKAASDLLEKRSGKYSSRPQFPLHELVGWGDVLLFTPYGEHFQKQRKFFQQAFSRQESLVYQPLQLSQVHKLLKDLLSSPGEYENHTRQFTVSLIVDITYGYDIKPKNDPFITLVEDITAVLDRMGDNQILNVFPFLKHLPTWFPGAWWARVAQDGRPVAKRLLNEPFNEVLRSRAAGSTRPCFASLQLEELERQGGATEEGIYGLKIASQLMYTAGAETTWSTLFTFIAAMLLNPEVQNKAQAEIDAVVGTSRLPDFSDRPSLPYIEAVMYETMRWRPVAPLGIPHYTTSDDIYRGMYIPKDATVFANLNAMAWDDTVYRNPHEFRPDRFLGPDAEPLPAEFAFGFGRRVCPGRYLAEASVWIVVANVLAGFEIVSAKDDQGLDIVPDIKFTSAMTSHPEPFPCSFRPRSDRIAEVIRQL